MSGDAQIFSKLTEVREGIDALVPYLDALEGLLGGIQTTLTAMNTTLTAINSKLATTNTKLAGGLPASLVNGKLSVTGLL